MFWQSQNEIPQVLNTHKEAVQLSDRPRTSSVLDLLYFALVRFYADVRHDVLKKGCTKREEVSLIARTEKTGRAEGNKDTATVCLVFLKCV